MIMDLLLFDYVFAIVIESYQIKVTSIRPIAPVQNRDPLEHKMLRFSVRKEIIENDHSCTG